MRRVTHRYGAASLLLAAALLSSCSSIPLLKRQAAERARFVAYAGKPVSSFIWVIHYNGWEPISHDMLVIWTNIDQPYLITVYPPCTNLMLTRHIGLTSFADTVSARHDFVKADGWKCMIKTIQPVDYRRMLRDERKARAAAPHAVSHATD